jgi:vitamin B12 transporter
MLRIACGLLAVLYLCQSAAQDDGDAVVITASRSEQLLREAIPHTTVLTRQDIRSSQAVDLPTLLRREAGFEFTQNGGIGGTSGTFLRGTATAQSLVLVDGVRVADLNNGIASLDQFMLDEIDRVEIVRGSVGSLYGSGAIGGVIQIFTRRGEGAPAPAISLGAGGEGDRRVAASYGGQTGDTRFNVTASRFATKGFLALRPGASATANPDNDGYRNESYAANVSHRVAAGHEAGVSFYSTAGRQEYDNAFALAATTQDFADVRMSSWRAFLNNQFSQNWVSRLTIAESANMNHAFQDAATVSRTRTQTRQYGWQNDLIFGAGLQKIMAGLERVEQDIEGTIAYTRTSRDVNALLGGYQGRFGVHNLQLNLRAERYSDFGDTRTYLAGYAFDISERWRVFASHGTGFRAPTFNELFFPPIALGAGVFLACNDPNLKPERSRSSDAGVQYASGGTLLKVSAFRTRIRDAIAPGCPPSNVNQAMIDGIETSLTARWWGTLLKGALTVQDPVQRTAAGEAQLLRRAKRFGSVSAVRPYGPWQFGGEVLASGEKPDTVVTSFAGARTTLPAYAVVNLFGRYAIRNESYLAVRVENVLDKDYLLTHGFNVQRRKFTLSFNHRF